MSESPYHERIQRFRETRDKEMTSRLNWLSLVGLFWLEEGDNSFGNHAANKIIIPMFARNRGGVFRLEDGRVFLFPDEDSRLRVNGRLPDSRPLRADQDGEPDLIETGSLAMRVIKRDQRTLLRVWDTESPAARNFNGLKYYPIRPEYCVSARFVPHRPPRTVRVLTVIGTEHDDEFVGQAQFCWDGVECHLDAQGADEELLFNFTDRTSEDTTYPGGRLLKAPKPERGRVILDFNLASNWPCAYTPFAACPIPPIENRLAVRIEAGEMKYHD